MKNRVQRLVLGVFVWVVVAFSPTGLFAAVGDLYSGGLANPRAITKFAPDGTPTTFANNIFADALAFDAKGNLFVGNTESNTIIKITPGGTRTTFAMSIKSTGLAFDASGILYATDSVSHALYKFTPGGGKTLVSNFGTPQPFGVAVDPSGNLFVSLTNNTIVKIPPGGSATTFASGLNSPEGLAADRLGNLYVADFGSGKVFKFTPTKTTFASGLTAPRQLTIDDVGNVFVAVHGTQQILKFGPGGGTSTLFASSTNAGGLAFERPTAQLTSISTRASVQTNEGVTIAGFAVTGTDSKQVVARGLGPTLTLLGVTGAVLADPTLDLHDVSNSIYTNDNWKDTQQAAIQATGLQPPNNLESAIARTSAPLAPGNYTAILAGKNGGTGIGLVEVYDIATGALSELTSVSTRGFVGTGDGVMIGGIAISGGNGFAQVVVRGLGPTLTQLGVTGAVLADPTLRLVDENNHELFHNNNWKESQQTAIQATGLAPPNDLESAIVITLPAGNYTAILEGNGGGTGIGLVEIYKLR